MNITMGNVISGTPPYMCPEVISRKNGIDGRSDLYAIGCILFELLAVNPPFTADAMMDFLRIHLEQTPVRAASVILMRFPPILMR